MTRTKNNTELIVIVTPEIVAPIPAGQVPELKYPVAFLPPNSNIPMNTPDAKTPENTLPPTPTSIPVETMIDSMKPEKPLVIETQTGGFGTGTQSINSSGGTSVPAPTAPQQ